VNYITDLHKPQVGSQQFDHLQVLTVQSVLFSVLQLLLAMAASLGYMTTGLVRGFSSPGVPSMQQISPHLVPDESAVSWISKYVIPQAVKTDIGYKITKLDLWHFLHPFSLFLLYGSITGQFTNVLQII